MLYLVNILGWLLMVLGILISVAFMILLERKALGYIQIRKGPNKLGLLGVIQSVADAIKLFIKEFFFLINSNFSFYIMSPVVSLIVSLFMWSLIPVLSGHINYGLGLVFFMSCSAVGVYILIGSGWSSNSLYALLGCMRGTAQTISYEVSMALIILSLVFMVGSYELLEFNENQDEMWLLMVGGVMLFMLFVSVVAETNRSPFDFAEGESELVSGFNIEYGSGSFALLFLAEYSSIIFMGILLIYMSLKMSVIVMVGLGMFMSFVFIWLRGAFPSYRYDMLMDLAWSIYLPVVLMMFMYYMMLSVMS